MTTTLAPAFTPLQRSYRLDRGGSSPRFRQSETAWPTVAILGSARDTRDLESALLDAGYRLRRLRTGESGTSASVVVTNLTGGWSETAIATSHAGALKPAARIALLRDEQLPRLSHTDPRFDDFLVFPFNPREAVARIQRAISRNVDRERLGVLDAGELRLDLDRFEVWRGEERVHLTFREFELLRYLIVNRGNAVSREEIMRNVWGYDVFGGDRAIDVHVRRLRVKVNDNDHSLIQTVRYVGYRMRADEPRLPQRTAS